MFDADYISIILEVWLKEAAWIYIPQQTYFVN